MNRFKFRNYYHRAKEMQYCDTPVVDGSYDVKIKGKAIIMQSIGLLDINNKIIYEGDILKCYDSRFGNKFAIVQWNQSEVSFELFNPDDVYHDDDGNCEGDGISYFYFYDKFEVVGNIHENDNFEFNFLKRSLAKTK